jgi:hypothetical protein
LPFIQGAAIAARWPDSSDWLTQPSVPSASRICRQLSYSWTISTGRPAFRYIHEAA